MSVDLKPYTKKLSGGDYVMVAGRVLLAHSANPENLSIVTEIVSMDADVVTVRAIVTTAKGTFTGHASTYIQTGSPQERKSPLEVAETSAIGRALGFAGYALEHGLASADEMERNANGHSAPSQPRPQPRAYEEPPARPFEVEEDFIGELEPDHATEKQVKAIYAIGRTMKWTERQTEEAAEKAFGVPPANLSKKEASTFIDSLKAMAGTLPG